MPFLTLGTSSRAPRRRAARREKRTVADLVVQLGEAEPGQVRGLIARTLGDPTLQLGLWYEEHQTWVDEHGRELKLPTSRGVTFLGRDLAVLVHDPRLLEQPELLESVSSAARLALENEQLQAALRAQLTEARESRERIVRRGDEERRRLERDLHDGAQQRLLGLGMGAPVAANAHPRRRRRRLPRHEHARASAGPERAARTRTRNPPGNTHRPRTRGRSHHAGRAITDPRPPRMRPGTVSSARRDNELPGSRRSARQRREPRAAQPPPRSPSATRNRSSSSRFATTESEAPTPRDPGSSLSPTGSARSAER